MRHLRGSIEQCFPQRLLTLFELRQLVLQFRQCRSGNDCIDGILDLRIDCPQLMLQSRALIYLLLLLVLGIRCCCQLADLIGIQILIQCCRDFFMQIVCINRSCTLAAPAVIVMPVPRSRAAHRIPTLCADQLPRQHIVIVHAFALLLGGNGKALLYRIKELPLHDLRTWHHALKAAEGVFTDIDPPVQEPAHIHRFPGCSGCGRDAPAVHMHCDLSEFHAAEILPEDLRHQRRCCIIRNKPAVDQLVSERSDPVQIVSLPETFLDASLHFPCKLRTIVLIHRFEQAFHDDALRGVTDGFGRRDHPHTAVTELLLINGAVIAIPGEAVELVDQHCLESAFPAVCDHALELWPVVAGTAERPVDVLGDDLHSVLCCIFLADVELPFDRLLGLVGRAVASVEYDFFHKKFLLAFFWRMWYTVSVGMAAYHCPPLFQSASVFQHRGGFFR